MIYAKGQKVIMASNSKYLLKSIINGHTCRINRKIKLVEEDSYILDWNAEDNPGRTWPEAIEDYFYMDNDILPVSIDYPVLNTVKLSDLPEI